MSGSYNSASLAPAALARRLACMLAAYDRVLEPMSSGVIRCAWALSSQLAGSSGSGSSRMIRCPPRVTMMRTAQSGVLAAAHKASSSRAIMGRSIGRSISAADLASRSRCAAGVRPAIVGAQALEDPVAAGPGRRLQQRPGRGARGAQLAVNHDPRGRWAGHAATFCLGNRVTSILATTGAAAFLSNGAATNVLWRVWHGPRAVTGSSVPSPGTRLRVFAGVSCPGAGLAGVSGARSAGAMAGRVIFGLRHGEDARYHRRNRY